MESDQLLSRSLKRVVTQNDQETAAAISYSGGNRATILSGPPLPPSIFIGNAVTLAPAGGKAASEATFSKIGMFARRV